MFNTPWSFKDHFCELRNRLLFIVVFFVIAFACCYYFSSFLQNLLIAPLEPILNQGRELVYTGLTEAFFSEINTAFFVTLLLVFPIFLGQLWAFLKPGLFLHEQKIFRIAFIAIPFLFYLGVAFAQFVVLPRAFKFFISFEHKNLPLYFLPKLSDYLSFSQRLMFVFGLGFELPVILFTLVKMKLLTLQSLKSRWRLVVLAICVVSAVITPPDAISMIALALPMIALYGVTLIMIQCTQTESLDKNDHA